MKRALWLGGLLSLHALQAGACNLKTGLVPFPVDEAAVSRPAPEDALDAPEIRLMTVVRGVGGAAGSCDGSGMLILRLEAPDGDYEPNELGYEFRLVSAQSPYRMLPDAPVAVSADASRNEVVLLWPDDVPGQQQPVHMQIEVRAVTHDGQFGPAAILDVDTRDPAVIAAEREQQREAEKARKKLEKEQEKERKRLERELENAG